MEIDRLKIIFRGFQIHKVEHFFLTLNFSANYKISVSLIQTPVFLLKGYIVYFSKICSE